MIIIFLMVSYVKILLIWLSLFWSYESNWEDDSIWALLALDLEFIKA